MTVGSSVGFILDVGAQPVGCLSQPWRPSDFSDHGVDVVVLVFLAAAQEFSEVRVLRRRLGRRLICTSDKVRLGAIGANLKKNRRQQYFL